MLHVIRHKLTLVSILSFFIQTYFAQQYTLSGKVTSSGENLPFATIYLKGTTKGVNSNDDGNYSLKLEKVEQVVGIHLFVVMFSGRVLGVIDS